MASHNTHTQTYTFWLKVSVTSIMRYSYLLMGFLPIINVKPAHTINPHLKYNMFHISHMNKNTTC